VSEEENTEKNKVINVIEDKDASYNYIYDESQK
jgi:hypothetical protein